MPYANLPKSLWSKQDSCVKQVMAQGHDKPSAIAICYASLMKERKERRLTRLEALKASSRANPHAQSGDIIGGNLARGDGGKFARSTTSTQPRPAIGLDIAHEDIAAIKAFRKAKPTGIVSSRLHEAGLIETKSKGTMHLTHAGVMLLRAMKVNDASAIAKALSAGRNKPSVKESGIAVFKQADGNYRWVTYSSNAYEDSDREIIPQAVLEADVARMDAEKAYGPLRWWHVGDVQYKEAGNWQTSYAGDGVNLGTCDYNAMHGKVLIESGIFAHPLIGEHVKANADNLQVSIGLTHPINEPINGTFQNVRRFERSLLPKGRAANPFTGVLVTQEQGMNQAKELALKALLGNDYDKVAAVLSGADAVEKQAQDAGVKFKAETPPVEVPTMAETKEETKEAAPVVAPVVEVKAEDKPVETKADAAPAADANAPEPTFVGDMTAEEFTLMLAKAFSAAMQPLMDAMSQQGMAAQSATKETRDTTVAALTNIDTRLKELEGDAPKGRGFQASTSEQTVKQGNPSIQAVSANGIEQLASFWLTGNNKAQ